jgi:hypothetical protein
LETSTSTSSSSSHCDNPNSSDSGCFKPDLILANQLAYGQVRHGDWM